MYPGYLVTWISCILDFSYLGYLASWISCNLDILHPGFLVSWISCLLKINFRTWISCILDRSPALKFNQVLLFFFIKNSLPKNRIKDLKMFYLIELEAFFVQNFFLLSEFFLHLMLAIYPCLLG